MTNHRPISFRIALAAYLSLLSFNASAQISFNNVTDTNVIGGVRSETWGASVGDLDGDFWPDIYVGNHRNRPAVYRNNGDGTLTNSVLQVDTSAEWLNNRFIDHHGGAWSDFDGDGDDDLISGTNSRAKHALMVSDQHRFVNESSRLPSDSSSSYSTWFDFDLDGDSDLFQGRDGANLRVYYRQRSNGTFSDKQTVNDCDGDWAFLSDIDDDEQAEYVCNVEGAFPSGVHEFSTGSLVDISHSSGLPSVGNVVDNTAADLNNDLKPDLVFLRGAISTSNASQHGPNRIEISADTGRNETVIFKFNGGGTLSLNAYLSRQKPIQQVVSSSTTIHGFIIDYNQGADEWTVTRTGSRWQFAYLEITSTRPMSNLQNVQVSARDLPMQPRVYRRENGDWVNRTYDSGLSSAMDCKSVVAADFDNDMDLDLYFVCGRGGANLPNRLFSNDGRGKMIEVPNAGGAQGSIGAPLGADLGTGESAVTADFNNDGFMDLFVLNGNNSQPTRGRYGKQELILNAGNSNAWIELELVGTTSDADATGARVVATAGGISQLRETGAVYHRWSQNHNRVHFGLGPNTAADITVRWPSGLVETFNNVSANNLYVVTEGSGITTANVSTPGNFPAPVVGDECGEPNYLVDMDTAVFLYRDCNSGQWSLRGSASLHDSTSYIGRLSSDLPISNVSPVSIGPDSTLDTSSNNAIGFELNVARANEDGFNFSLNDSAVTCLNINTVPGLRVLVGPSHLPVTLPIDLNTMQACNSSGPPELSVADVQIDENAGVGEFVVTLSPANNTAAVTVRAAGRRLTATPREDYYGFSVPLTFQPGETSKTVSVTILDDDIVEPNERLGVRLLDVQNAIIAVNSASMTIIDDDVVGGPTTPELSVRDAMVNEAAGVGYFAVTLSAADATQAITVKASGTAGSATKGAAGDYFGFFRDITFPADPRQNPRTVYVPVTILNDSRNESNETLGVRLFAPVGADITTRSAVMTIIDDD